MKVPRRHRASTRAGWRRGLAALAWLVAAAVLAACASLRPAAPEPVTQYVLTAEPASPGARASREIVIEVGAVRAWPGYDTPRLAYTREANAIDYYAASRWVDTPEHMLGPLVVRALEHDGGFRVVASPGGARVRADYRLDVELVRLVQEFATPPSHVALTLRVQLTDLRTRRVVATETMTEREPAPAENAAGGAAAANTAVRRALARVVELCVAATSSR